MPLPQARRETWPLDQLKRAPYNPRSIDEASAAALKAGIAEFGLVQDIVVNERTGNIVGGHQRVDALWELGETKAPVTIVDLGESEEKALNVLLNSPLAAGEFTDDLDELLRSIQSDIPIFEELRLDELLGPDPVEPPEPAPGVSPEQPEDDEVPEAPEPMTVVGEVVSLGRHALTCGDCVEVMALMADGCVDAIVTDPPYGLGFMGKEWDSLPPGDDFAREALRVLKPGGHIVAFGGTRTLHRLTVALEDAGFEIRDTIHWLQYQGFPKNLDVSKAIDAAAGVERRVVGTERNGWGTALKPAIEPAVLARKPLDGTVANTVLKHGTGAINIDGCRYPDGDSAWPGPDGDGETRWPANVYACPKPARSEKEAGADGLPATTAAERTGRSEGSAGLEMADGKANPYAGNSSGDAVRNHHPTVKPVRLMRWLVRLVTPPGGVVLEPFAGSGTTLVAAEREGVDCIGIEREPAYCDIIRARVEHAIGGAE